MSGTVFNTYKVTFDRDALPPRFTWLARQTGWLSVSTKGDDSDAAVNAECVVVIDAFERWLAPVLVDASPREENEIRLAMKRELLDWVASAFDVFGIDVELDRMIAKYEAQGLPTPAHILATPGFGTANASGLMSGDALNFFPNPFPLAVGLPIVAVASSTLGMTVGEPMGSAVSIANALLSGGSHV